VYLVHSPVRSCLCFCFYSSLSHSDIHSFPTRRSSDLQLEFNEVFVGSISGAVGTYAAFDGRGIEVERLTLAELGLVVPNISWQRSEEHTSDLQSRFDLVCRLLLEKKKNLNCLVLYVIH